MYQINKKLKDIKPKDLLFVILYGVVISILLGVALGFVDYYLIKLVRIRLAGLMFFISSMYIGRLVRKQYETPHLVYSIITGVCLVLQAIIIYALPDVFHFIVNTQSPITFVFDIRLYYYYIVEFFQLLISNFSVNFLLNILITVLILSVGTYVGVKNTY